jgi:hypothetical protein
LQCMLGHSSPDMVKKYLAIIQSNIETVHRLVSLVDNGAL